jgi:hypothetical protein
MIDHAEMKLGSLELEQFLPKIAGKIWITVGDNRVENSMKFEDIIHENLNHCGCYEWLLGGTYMSIFGKVIDDNHDD